jgi:hypothetical protein
MYRANIGVKDLTRKQKFFCLPIASASNIRLISLLPYDRDSNSLARPEERILRGYKAKFSKILQSCNERLILTYEF